MRVKNITSPTRNWVGRQRLRWGAKLLIAILKSIEIIKPSTNDAWPPKLLSVQRYSSRNSGNNRHKKGNRVVYDFLVGRLDGVGAISAPHPCIRAWVWSTLLRPICSYSNLTPSPFFLSIYLLSSSYLFLTDTLHFVEAKKSTYTSWYKPFGIKHFQKEKEAGSVWWRRRSDI